MNSSRIPFVTLLIFSGVQALRHARLPSTGSQRSTDNEEPDIDVTQDEWIKMLTDEDVTQLEKAQLRMNVDEPNVCIKNKVVPKLYLLGAQKAGTTSLSYDLMMAGVKSAAGLGKEWNFAGLAGSRSEWLEALPPGPCNGKRYVLADFTPNNLKLTYLPDNMHLYRGWPGGGDGSSTDYKLSLVNQTLMPKRLQEFYHDELKNKLVFVVMLREPLERMQSAWYGLRRTPLKQGRISFAADVNVSVDFFRSSNGHSILEWMWYSLYGPAIAEYLVHFSASQFVVVPMKQYTKSSDKVVDAILQRLGASPKNVTGADGEEWDHPGGENNLKNEGEHPPLDEDVDPEVRAAFDQEIKKYNDQLVSLLKKMYSESALLIGMDKEHPSEEDIRNWLYDNW